MKQGGTKARLPAGALARRHRIRSVPLPRGTLESCAEAAVNHFINRTSPEDQAKIAWLWLKNWTAQSISSRHPARRAALALVTLTGHASSL
jgi:hypothetical protein